MKPNKLNRSPESNDTIPLSLFLELLAWLSSAVHIIEVLAVDWVKKSNSNVYDKRFTTWLRHLYKSQQSNNNKRLSSRLDRFKRCERLRFVYKLQMTSNWVNRWENKRGCRHFGTSIMSLVYSKLWWMITCDSLNLICWLQTKDFFCFFLFCVNTRQRDDPYMT